MTKTVTLGEVCTISSENFKPNGSSKYYVGLEHIEKDTGKVLPEAKEEVVTAIKNSFRRGDILYGKLRPYLNKVSLATRDGVCSTDILVLQPNKNIIPNYLLHYMLSRQFVDDMSANVSGANLPRVSTKYVLGYPIPLPSLDEQRRIAALLDRADALRQKDRQLLAHYDQLAQSLFLDLFGDPVRNEKGWAMKKLKDVCRKITDGTHFSPPNVEKGVPYITAKHLKVWGLDFFRDPTYVSQLEHEKIFSRCTPRKGDVLYIKDGATTGLAAVNNYDFEFSMLSSLALIKLDKAELNNHYLVNYLNYPAVKDSLLNSDMAGAAIKRFTLQKINNFLLPVPPLPLQNYFAGLIEQIEKQKAVVRQQLSASDALFSRLLQESFGNV